MNQGPRGDCLIKKTEGRKSRDTVPLSAQKDTHTKHLRTKRLLILLHDIQLTHVQRSEVQL
jgi:hypothetical protein